MGGEQLETKLKVCERKQDDERWEQRRSGCSRAAMRLLSWFIGDGGVVYFWHVVVRLCQLLEIIETSSGSA